MKKLDVLIVQLETDPWGLGVADVIGSGKEMG